jgi:hypothetical protein
MFSEITRLTTIALFNNEKFGTPLSVPEGVEFSGLQ